MTSEPRKDGMVPDPSQIAEMQATDARLDRLGRRQAHADDLADPLFAALAGLADEVDVVDPAGQDEAVAKLLEVLDGRPLWVLDGEELSELDAAKNMILLDDPTWDGRRRQVIDLRWLDRASIDWELNEESLTKTNQVLFAAIAADELWIAESPGDRRVGAVHVATVPALPKSTSSGCASTQRARSTWAAGSRGG